MLPLHFFTICNILVSISILKDGKSWKLPLPHDDPLQPLYRGPPLPLCVLVNVGIEPDEDGTYENSDPNLMAKTCREMAAWKLAGNGPNVSKNMFYDINND